VTTHVQDGTAQTGGGTTFTVPITTTAGHCLVLYATQWVTSNTALHIVSISDTAGNTWNYSTATANQNPPVNGSYDASVTQYGMTAIACCLVANAVTSVTVVLSGSGDFAEVQVQEFSGLPAGARVLGAASNGTLASGVSSITTPSVNAPSGSPVLVCVNTSLLNGEWTGASSGYTLLSFTDTLAAYNVAATAGSAVSCTLTTGATWDVPSSAILVIGAPPAVTSAGSLAMAPLGVSGAAGENIASAGHLAMAPLGVSGAGSQTGGGVTSAGSLAMAPLGMSGAGSEHGSNVTGTGHLAMAALGTSAGGAVILPPEPSTFIGTLPGVVGANPPVGGRLGGPRLGSGPTVQTGMPAAVNPAGYPGGPAGVGAITPSAVGNGWEIQVVSAADYVTLLAVIPSSMLVSFQFAMQLDDIGSGTVVLSQDDPWWQHVTLPGGLPSSTLLDEECLWQFWQDGVRRFEFFGETVTEQLVDPSEQRTATITGPGTIAALKWAMIAPQGFPDIILKLDGILDSFDETDVNGNGVLDTNIWTTATPAADVYITPTGVIYNYPGGTGYALSTLYPSGSVTLVATPGTTFLGASPYDATNTLISAQVTPVGVSANAADSSTPAPYGAGLNGSQLTQFYIESNLNTAYYALFGLSASAFYCQFRGPSGTYTKVLPAYNPTSHAYWQITEQGGTPGGSGTFYFWTSPDGQTWTQQWTIVHNWDATDVSLYFTASYSGTGQSAQLTNLNSNVTTPSYQGRIYLNVPLMGVWLDQFEAAKARGTIPFMHTDTSATADSFGRAWSDAQNVQATNGTDLYSFLQSAASVVNADYIMLPGFQLRVGQPAPGQVALGTDRSSYLILREGYDCAAKTRVRARNQITTLIGGENADGHEISASSPGYIAQWGQREAWYQTAVQVDPTSMAYATASALAQNETEILSWTLQLAPNLPGRTVFENFSVGDWLGLERPDFSAVDDVRVMGIAVSVDSGGNEAHELTLISYIQWLQEQLTYISSRLGGQFVNVLGTSPVAPSKYGTGQVPTYFDPAATLARLADVATGSAGSTLANSPLVYNPTTGNYQLAGTTDPVTGSTLPSSVSSPTASNTQAPDTTVIVVNGATRTTVGLQGDGTVTVVDSNGPAPGVPDTPAAVGVIAGVTITWDGKVGGGATPLSDFQYVQVYLGTSSSFTPGPSTLMGTLQTAGTVAVNGLTAGVTYWAKLTAVNTSGNASAPTPGAAATATGVPGGIVTGQLPASVLGNSAGSWALNPNPFFNGGSLTGWAAANATLTATQSVPAGAPGAPPWCAQLASTAANGYMNGSPAPFPVTAGQPYSMTAWVYNPSGSAVNVQIGFNWAGGLQTFSVPPAIWTPLAMVSDAPSGTTSGYQVIELPSSGVTVYVTGAVAAGQVQGQLIEALSITANQIAVGIILAGVVNGTLVEGAQFVAYGTSGEVFVYAGPPAVGNLIGSWSATAGNDSAVSGGAGNSYPAGLMIGAPGSSNLVLQPNADQAFNLTTAIAGVLTAMTQYNSGDSNEVIPGLIGAMDVGSGGTTKQSLVVSSPLASTTGAAMLLESENDTGSDTAVVTFGTTSTPDGETLVFTPLMALSPYAMILYSGAGSQVIVTKTSGSGTIPIPAGITVAKGESWGPGGGGGGGNSSGFGGSAGGGGGYGCEPVLAVPSGGTVSYSVGSGGSGGAVGSNGGAASGASTLTGSSATVTGNPGSPGNAGSGVGGNGGAASGNSIANTGGFGAGNGGGAGGGGGGGSGGSGGFGNGGDTPAGTSGTNGGAGGPAVAGGGAGGAGGASHASGASPGQAGFTPGGGGGGGGSRPGVNISPGAAGANGQVRLSYITGTPSVGFFVNTGPAFIDQYGNSIPAGPNLGTDAKGVLTLAVPATAPAAPTAGAKIFPAPAGSATGTSVEVMTGSGAFGYVPLVQVDAATYTATSTGYTAITKAWSIPANTAQFTTMYEVEVPFFGLFENQTLTWTLWLNSSQQGAAITIGPAFFPSASNFAGTIRAKLQVVSTGGSGAASVFLDGGVGNAGTRSSGTNNNNGYLSSTYSTIAFNTTAANTVAVAAEWGATASGETITGYGSKFTRLGP
jgi:hypothetical protein